ncbi:DUF485 domain-containing protein [Streptomyces sp. Marseille-Q5077]|uniref:DUF485 domain-containing protein n=1 Tax=Streptomyces sp. Marseille-Q5077 TaxID=3418995 RepID=UPI003D086974
MGRQFTSTVDCSKRALSYSGFRLFAAAPRPPSGPHSPVCSACRSEEGAPVPEFSPWHDKSLTYSSPVNAPVPSKRISEDAEFHSLRRAQRRFGVRATILSVGGFLLYVLLSHAAPGLMNQRLTGNLTLGLALGLGQFVVMGVTAWCYVRHMRTRVDPLARGLASRLRQQELGSPHAAAPHGEAGGHRTW